MHSDVTPKFLKPSSVPYALKPAIEDLERLEYAGINIKQDWATPIVSRLMVLQEFAMITR